MRHVPVDEREQRRREKEIGASVNRAPARCQLASSIPGPIPAVPRPARKTPKRTTAYPAATATKRRLARSLLTAPAMSVAPTARSAP
jgi:hypothetical protein